MELILEKVLQPDSAAIAEGTQELKKAFQSPSAIPELCTVMSTSNSPQIRQYAALLLRKKFGNFKTWKSMNDTDRGTIKQGCLTSLLQDSEKSSKMSIAQLVAIIAKHEIKLGSWPELDHFLRTNLGHPDPLHRLLGIYTLTVLCETIGHRLKDHFRIYGKSFQCGLEDENLEVGFYTVRAMTHLIPFVGSDELNIVQPLIGQVLLVIDELIAADQEDKACQAMEIFDELFECELAIVLPYIKPIIEMCLKFAADQNLEVAIRLKAISFLGRLTRLKKKAIVKHKLHVKMINVLFQVMANRTEGDHDDDEGEEDDFNLMEGNSPFTCACQTLDIMAMNLPPEKFMTAILSHVEPAMKSGIPSRIRAAFNALAVCAEGCADFIKSKYLVSFLELVGNGIKQDNAIIRNGALSALGQFSEYLQPDISNYSNEIIPVLLGFIDHQCFSVGEEMVPTRTPPGLDRIFYALEIFCENLGKTRLTPYLNDLMQRLFALLNGANFSPRIKELSICTIGAIANAIHEEIQTYHEEILKYLKVYLADDSTTEQGQLLLTQSMDTMALLARAMESTPQGPRIAEDCCKFGFSVLQAHTDPDIKKCAYALFASVAFVVKEQIGAIIKDLFEYLMDSCRSKSGITYEPRDLSDDLPIDLEEDDDEDEGGLSANDEDVISLNTDDSNTDGIMDLKAINVETAFIEEKGQALIALKEICKYSFAAFAPYLQASLDETWKLLEFPDEDIRKAAIETVVEFICSLKKIAHDHDVLQRCIVDLVPKLCTMVKEEQEVTVVCVCLEELSHLLKGCTDNVTSIQGHPEQIVQCVRLVMKSECKCMDPDQLDDGDEEAEQDEILFEYAGDVLPSLGMAMTGETFSPYFAGILPHLIKKTKRQCSDSERSFSAGALAECIKPLKGVLDPYINVLMPTFLSMVRDPDNNVRNNSVYGLGELALYGGAQVHAQFPDILRVLSNLLSQEQNPRVIDQIVGAVCRLIISNADLVPIPEVLPVMLQNLPLKEDDEEYPVVFECLLQMYLREEPLVKQNLQFNLNLVANFLVKDKKAENEESFKNATKIIPRLLFEMRKSASDDFDALGAHLSPVAAAKIADLCKM